MIDYQPTFDKALDYATFLERVGNERDRAHWNKAYERIQLTPMQRRRLSSFTRAMHVLCLADVWCDDCITQCPIFQRFADATPCLHLRLTDRDTNPELAEVLRICGGSRVPMLVFLSEDGYLCGIYGDRTITGYRALLAEQVPAAGGPECHNTQSVLAGVTDDWLTEFERIQIMLRLSHRLRQKHGD